MGDGNDKEPYQNKSDDGDVRFEDAYRELAEIIDRLEAGDQTLDDSMTLFERGHALVLLCEKQLNAAQLRVSQLLGDSDGSTRLEPMG